MKNKIGVIGGMGPLATAILLERVIDYTDAKKDQENIPLVILNDTLIPDRTEYILNNKNDSPLPYLLKDLHDLELLDCTHACIACNTSHYFYETLQNQTNINILNMVKLTIDECKKRGFKKVGLLSTKGTADSHIYNDSDVEIMNPNDEIQLKITKFIYENVKKNIKVDENEFYEVLKYYYENGCDGVILGCTELSVIQKELSLESDEKIVDSTSEIAKEIIRVYKES